MTAAKCGYLAVSNGHGGWSDRPAGDNGPSVLHQSCPVLLCSSISWVVLAEDETTSARFCCATVRVLNSWFPWSILWSSCLRRSSHRGGASQLGLPMMGLRFLHLQLIFSSCSPPCLDCSVLLSSLPRHHLTCSIFSTKLFFHFDARAQKAFSV